MVKKIVSGGQTGADQAALDILKIALCQADLSMRPLKKGLSINTL